MDKVSLLFRLRLKSNTLAGDKAKSIVNVFSNRTITIRARILKSKKSTYPNSDYKVLTTKFGMELLESPCVAFKLSTLRNILDTIDEGLEIIDNQKQT